jgi:hypothetical protein
MLFHRGTMSPAGASAKEAVRINYLLVSGGRWSACLGAEGQVESNARYYRRRAVEERMAAQRAVTETARVWHSKLAQDFAERASACTASICNAATVNG